MALVLLLSTVGAAIGFLIASVTGFIVTFHGPHDPMVRFLVSRHVLASIPAVLLSLFSQSMVIFYFIGTGKLIKDEAADLPDEQRGRVLKAVRRFKAKTSPPATFSMLAAIFVFVIGGWAHTAAGFTRSVARQTHLWGSVLAFSLHLWALSAESATFLENQRLMNDPARYAP